MASMLEVGEQIGARTPALVSYKLMAALGPKASQAFGVAVKLYFKAVVVLPPPGGKIIINGVFFAATTVSMPQPP